MQGSRGPGYKRGMKMSFEKNDPRLGTLSFTF